MPISSADNRGPLCRAKRWTQGEWKAHGKMQETKWEASFQLSEQSMVLSAQTPESSSWDKEGYEASYSPCHSVSSSVKWGQSSHLPPGAVMRTG